MYLLNGKVIWFYKYLALPLVLWLLHRWLSRRRLPPGPPSIPILGCVPFLPLKNLSLRLFTSDEMCKKYGSVIRFEIGVRQFYVLNDYNQVKNERNCITFIHASELTCTPSGQKCEARKYVVQIG